MSNTFHRFRTYEQQARAIRTADESGNPMQWKIAREDRESLKQDLMVNEGASREEADAWLKSQIDD